MIARQACAAAFLSLLLVGGCGDDDDDDIGLEDFYPELPAPTGEAQGVWAGEITSANADELVDGPARSGLVGDYFMRNSRVRLVIQSTKRVLGVVPQGGNLVDAVLVDGDGNAISEDHFGELSLVYLVGRTCEHQEIEIVQDGSGGGAAVIRAVGVTARNDYINLRGIGLLNVPLELDPDIDDEVQCASTYVLEPDSDTLQVYWTLYNPTEINVRSPFGALNDSGGDTESWSPTRGFERLGIDALLEAGDPAPIDYVVYQGPHEAYGIVPIHDPSIPNATFLVAGVSIVLYGADTLLDILESDNDKQFLQLLAGTGLTHEVEVVVGRDAADVEERYRAGIGETTAEISGSVAWASGGVPEGARVAVFEDQNSDGQVDDDDLIRSYMDVDESGNFSGKILPGDYLLRADIHDVARSEVEPVTLGASGLSGVSMELPDPIYFDYSIVNDEDDNFIPGRITVFGRHPAEPDMRVYETYDRVYGVIKKVESLRGTTVVGEDADPQFALPPGSTYRIMAARGTEWSVDSKVVTVEAGDGPQTLEFRLRKVAPAEGYISTDLHVHMVGSPDSPVLNDRRVATAVADGTEVFAATDHDYITDLMPVVEDLGVERYVHTMPGVEVTSFCYGHWNSYPVNVDLDSANHGTVDWAAGMDGYAMLPGEIFQAMRDIGAVAVQANHVRATPDDVSDFQQYFDRAGLVYDYDNRMFDGDVMTQPVPNSWMRLPEASMWSDDFNVLEIWNGFSTADSNDDGVREIAKLDMTLRDWFNFLSFGFEIAPVGNSDTHTIVKDPHGMPRSYVRVLDDSESAIESGAAIDEVLDTLVKRNNTPIDVVVTNGPFISVSADGLEGSALGQVIDSTAGNLNLTIHVYSAEWAEIDTIEVFANETPTVGVDVEDGVSALQPRYCFTSRPEPLAENDTCALAVGGARPLTMELVDAGNGFMRYEATANLTVDPADIENREGATDGDAWFVVRVYGTRAIFPILLEGLMNDATLDTLVDGAIEDQIDILDGSGVPATAVTSPIYVDFDGGGYTPIFSPQ